MKLITNCLYHINYGICQELLIQLAFLVIRYKPIKNLDWQTSDKIGKNKGMKLLH